MATLTGNYVDDNSSLANFKQWAQAISNAFSTFGWVKTSDTGQVDWTALATVPSNAFVYEIWQSADSLSSTLPIVVRIEYGYSSTSVQVRLSVGTASNGTGSITGNVISGAPWNANNLQSNAGSSVYPCFFSGDSGTFRMFMWQNSNACFVAIIERSVDSTGNYTADYFSVITANSNSPSSGFQQTVTASGAANRENGVIAPALTNGSGTGYWNGSVAALPVFPVIGKIGNPMLSVMTCVGGDAADGSIVTVQGFYGSTHTFVAANRGQLAAYCGTRQYNTTNMALLMRYE